MPGPAARRGPLIVLAALGALWVAHGTAARLAFRPGPYESGILTLLTMLAAALYVVRRRFLLISLYLVRLLTSLPLVGRFKGAIVRLDQLKSWRVGHLAIGTLALLPLWWHVEAARGGALEQALLVAIGLVMVTGLLGVLLQYAAPQSMLQLIEREVRVRDVRAKQGALYKEAEERILGRSERLVQAYVEVVRSVLQGETSRLRLLEATVRRLDPGALVEGRGWRMLERLDEKDAATFRDLMDLATRKVRLDLNLFHLELGVAWLGVHAATVILAGLLLLIHITAVLYFGGV